VVAGLQILIPNGTSSTLEWDWGEATFVIPNTAIELGAVAGISHKAFGVTFAIGVG